MPYRPVSSCDGAIERLLVTIPPGSDDHIQAYYAEIESIFQDREMLIRFKNYDPPRNEPAFDRVGSQYKRNLESNLLAILEGREIFDFRPPDGFHEDLVGDLMEALQRGIPINHSEWAQDPFCVLARENCDSVFLQPLFSRRYMDKFISLDLASRRELSMLVRPTDLLLEGGNMLAGDGYMLIGKDTLAQNVLRHLERNRIERADQDLVAAIEARFREALGVETIWVGFDRAHPNWQRETDQTFQPAFHLDLFLTLGGKDSDGRRIILVGDPTLAENMLREAGIRPERIRISRAAKDQFARLDEFWERYTGQRPAHWPEFKIVKVPLYIDRNIPMPFNNGIVETWKGERIAYLPEYEVTAEADRYERLNPIFSVLKPPVEALLLAHGFDRIRWVGPGNHFRNLALMRGSLHCITKVLKRSGA
ncbi:MAG: hypothetical protein AAGN35_06570 [Bacteroidota bacterium]